jgi:ATP-dependent protease ClpP protease subunit
MEKTNRSSGSFLKNNAERRVMWLQGTITNQTAFAFESVLKKLNRDNHKDLTLFISGEGGDFYACLKIIHLINSSPSKFVIIAFDKVRSGCFFLTQAEKCKKRLAVPGTKFVFHHAVDTYVKSKLAKAIVMSQFDYEAGRRKLQAIDAVQVLLFSQKGKPIKRIFELFEKEAALSVRTALNLGLIDGTFSGTNFLRCKELIFGKETVGHC